MIRFAVIALVCFTSAQSQQRPFDIFDEIPLPRQHFAIQPAGVPARKIHITQPRSQPQPQSFQPQRPQRPPQRLLAASPGSPAGLSLTAHFDQLLLEAERQEEQAQRQQDIQERQQKVQVDQQQRERERKLEKLEALRDLYTEFPELAPAALPAGTPVAAAPSKPVPATPVRPAAPAPVARPVPQFQQARTRSQFKPQARPDSRPKFSPPKLAPKPQTTRLQPINVAEILQPAGVQPKPVSSQPQVPRIQPQPVRPAPIDVQNIIKPAPGKLFERPAPARPQPQPARPPAPRPQAARPVSRPAPVRIAPARPVQSKPAPARPAPARPAPARPAPARPTPARPAPARQTPTRPLPQFNERPLPQFNERPLPQFNERPQQVDAGRPIVQQQRTFGKQHTTLTSFTDVGIPLEPIVDEFARPTPRPFIDIQKTYQRKNADGTFTFGYTGEDGSFKEETRGNDCVVRGKYGYIDPEGMRREYTYVTGNPCDPNAPSVVNPEDPESLVQGGYYDYERDVYVTPEGQEVQLALKRKGGHRRRFQ